MVVRQRHVNSQPALPPGRPSALGAGVLGAGTLAYGCATVALPTVRSRHSHRTAFSAFAALLGRAFVVSLIPSGITLRSATMRTVASRFTGGDREGGW